MPEDSGGPSARPRLQDVIGQVRSERLSYLSGRALRELARAVRTAEREKIKGVLIEAGTARGGSAIVMAAAKRRRRELRLYDVFGLIPPPTDKDGRDVHRRYSRIASGAATGPGDTAYYGYADDLLGEVTASFGRYGLPVEQNAVTLVQGRFEDTLVVDRPVAVAHVDGDWYQSTMTCLERIVPRLSMGGRMVVDDYAAWSGCRRAVDEYFTQDRGCVLEQHARLHVVRVAPHPAPPSRLSRLLGRVSR